MFIDRIQALVTGYEDGWLALKAAENAAMVRLLLDGGAGAERDLLACRFALDACHGDDALYEQTEEALLASPDDPWLQRSLELMWSRVAAARGDVSRRRRLLELSTRFEAQRLGGFEGALLAISEARTPRERRRGWERVRELGALRLPLQVEQARLRREHAEELGYVDWTHAHLELDRLPADAMLRQRERLTEALLAHPPSEAELRNLAGPRQSTDLGVTDGPLRPWSFSGLWGGASSLDGRLADHFRERDPAELVRDTFDALGIDIGGILERRLPIPGRIPGASQIFAAGGEVSLAIDDRRGLDFLGGLLSAIGWGLGHACAEPTLPRLLKEPAHPVLGEALAMLCRGLTWNPIWLSQIAGYSPAGDEAECARLVGRGRASLRRSLSHSAATALLDDRLGAGDADAMPELTWAVAERFLGYERPADWEPGPEWVLWPGLGLDGDTSLLREGLAAQIGAGLSRTVGPAGLAGGPEAGGWLADRVLQHGAAMDWEDLVEQATGEPFSYGWALLRAGVPFVEREEAPEADVD